MGSFETFSVKIETPHRSYSYLEDATELSMRSFCAYTVLKLLFWYVHYAFTVIRLRFTDITLQSPCDRGNSYKMIYFKRHLNIFVLKKEIDKSKSTTILSLTRG